LNKSNTQDKLEFSNNLLNYIDSLDNKNFDALMPGLAILAKDSTEVKKSLLN